MSELDTFIAKAQRNLSAVTVALIAGTLVALFILPWLGAPPIDSTVENLLYVILGALLGSYASQNQFWFGRPRSAGVPDANQPPSVGPVSNVENMTVTAKPAVTSEEQQP